MGKSDEMLAESYVPTMGAIAPEKKDKIPPPIELPPFMVTLGSLPPLTAEIAVEAMTQLRTYLAIHSSSPDDTAALRKSLTALKILLGYHGRLLGALHRLFKQFVYSPDEPIKFKIPREPLNFPSSLQPVHETIPALGVLSALPLLPSLLPDINQYFATLGSELNQREFHERLFYDLKRIKSVLTPYFDLVAALSKQQPKKGRQAPESMTPLQILGRRYRLTLGEQMFYQELAEAGEAGMAIDPKTDIYRSFLLKNLMRKLPENYFDFLKPRYCRLSALGLQQLKLTQPQSTSS